MDVEKTIGGAVHHGAELNRWPIIDRESIRKLVFDCLLLILTTSSK